jgi:hypothetical protein
VSRERLCNVLTVDADGEDAYGMRFIFPKEEAAVAA